MKNTFRRCWCFHQQVQSHTFVVGENTNNGGTAPNGNLYLKDQVRILNQFGHPITKWVNEK